MAFKYFAFGLVSVVLLSPINAQLTPYPYDSPNPVAPDQLPSDCPATYNSANASGTYSLGASFANGDFVAGGNAIEDLTWTITVAQNTSSGEIETYSWLGTPPG